MAVKRDKTSPVNAISGEAVPAALTPQRRARGKVVQPLQRVLQRAATSGPLPMTWDTCAMGLNPRGEDWERIGFRDI